MARALTVLVALALVAGCGGDDAATTQARVYFLQDGEVEPDKVWPVARGIADDAPETEEVLAALVAGPSEAEEALGLTTAIPESATVTVSDSGELTVDGLGEPFDIALAQIVYTLTQFPGVEISYDGESLTRADFEQFTPSVLVESPLPFEEVTSPLRATGTANTFEANFSYELLDADGNVVDENFVTATSGTGTRGTFDFTTGDFDDVTALLVFELSAEDGSRIHEVEIPLRTSQ